MKREPTKAEFEHDIRQLKLAVGSFDSFLPPEKGFIRAMREWQGGSAKAFAERMAMKVQSVASIEKSEQKGKIRLDTLRRAANALDCTLVYTLIPNSEMPARAEASLSPMSDNERRQVLVNELLQQLTAFPESVAVIAEKANQLLARSKKPKVVGVVEHEETILVPGLLSIKKPQSS